MKRGFICTLIIILCIFIAFASFGCAGKNNSANGNGTRPTYLSRARELINNISSLPSRAEIEEASTLPEEALINQVSYIDSYIDSSVPYNNYYTNGSGKSANMQINFPSGGYYESAITSFLDLKNFALQSIIQLNTWVAEGSCRYKLYYDVNSDTATIEQISKTEVQNSTPHYSYSKVVSSYNARGHIVLNASYCFTQNLETHQIYNIDIDPNPTYVDYYNRDAIEYVEDEYCRYASERMDPSFSGMFLNGNPVRRTPHTVSCLLFEKDFRKESKYDARYIISDRPLKEYYTDPMFLDGLEQKIGVYFKNGEDKYFAKKVKTIDINEDIDSEQEYVDKWNYIYVGNNKDKLYWQTEFDNNSIDFIVDFLSGYKNIQEIHETFGGGGYSYTFTMDDDTIYDPYECETHGVIYKDDDGNKVFIGGAIWDSNEYPHVPTVRVSFEDINNVIPTLEAVGFSISYDFLDMYNRAINITAEKQFMGYGSMLDINTPKKFFDLYYGLFIEYVDKADMISKFDDIKNTVHLNNQVADKTYLELFKPTITGKATIGDNKEILLTNINIEIPINQLSTGVGEGTIQLVIRNGLNVFDTKLADVSITQEGSEVNFAIDNYSLNYNAIESGDYEISIYVISNATGLRVSDNIFIAIEDFEKVEWENEDDTFALEAKDNTISFVRKSK